MEVNAQKACSLLKTLSNESRLMVLCQLSVKEMSVGELLDSIPLSQSALSQHLSMLRRDNIVTTRRVAQSIKYSLVSEEARVLIAALYDIYCSNNGQDVCGLVNIEAGYI